MSEELITNLQFDFSSAGVEFLRVVEIKSSALFNALIPHLEDLDASNNNSIENYINDCVNEIVSLEGKFAFKTVVESLFKRGFRGAVVWTVFNLDDIRQILEN
ncbi:MAG: hypothetical protein EBU80_10425 [Chitinophagia bacterium]|nr:hypothetical protein [Chitinophagia bacterium]